jgi:exopolysaccharide biosynthesis polyprenyl glycosylphosphotransferase
MTRPRHTSNILLAEAAAVRDIDEACPGHVQVADRLEYRILKRGFDVALSGISLTLLAPLLLLIAIAVRATSAGPVLFRQRRVGMNGRLFWMYKFRTMKLASGASSERGWTREQDRRVTRLGRWLRHSSLDELPQLYNVIRGEMSLVGPRPERIHFVRKFNCQMSSYALRHAVLGGITGWAQVNGWRGDTSIQKRLEYDLYYLRHWSLWFDLRILLLTLVGGFRHPNAY